MQSKTEEFLTMFETRNVEIYCLKNFKLYEEYSHTNISDIIANRREKFNKADVKARKELMAKVENEVDNFCKWLEEKRNFEPTLAYYYSVSFKSLLLGIPIGVQIAQVFGTILEKLAEK